MLKRKIILPNQDQRRTNSVPTPNLLRKIKICTFADGGKGVACPHPLGRWLRQAAPTAKNKT